MTNRTAWGRAVALAVALLVGIGALFVRLQPYWVAKYRGTRTDLPGAAHPAAPLQDTWEPGANVTAASRKLADVGHADLTGADLGGAPSYPGDMSYAKLRGANLSGVTVARWTSLLGADLTGANLMGTSLDSVTLNSAHMRGVNLRQANLHAADVMNADLRGADLRAANLRAADFWNADLRDTQMAGAQYDAQTRWPEGFDPVMHGAILVRLMPEKPPSLVAMDAMFLAALFIVVGGLAAWITTALQLVWALPDRWIGRGEARDALWWGRFKVFRACVLFGAAYGAAFGSVYGPVLWLPSGDGALWAVKDGALWGAALGALGGGVAGFVGNMIIWRGGWILAGVLGSAAAAGCVWIVTCIAAGWEPAPYFRDKNLSDGALWCSSVILIGSFLGLALDRALRTGSSFVPGVRRLAAIINGGARPEQGVKAR